MKDKTAIFLTCLLTAAAAFADTFHVDCNAAKNGNGGKNSPFNTIQAAADHVKSGDTVIIAPGVYFETVRLRKTGTPDAPITFKAQKIKKNSVIITGADKDIRTGKVKWALADAALGMYSVPGIDAYPARVLYGGTDLFCYQKLELLKRFEAVPGVPGPLHGYFWDRKSKTLFVRLRRDGKYGSANPNEHVMSVAPGAKPFGKEAEPGSKAFNFGIFGKNSGAGDMHVVIEGITFETPGAGAVYTAGNFVTVRNCRFAGCRTGGIVGRYFVKPDSTMSNCSNNITMENCEWHNFPVFDDVKELVLDVKRGGRTVAPDKKRFHWWVHKSRRNGAVNHYETGIVRNVGKNWRVKNCYIHDCFEAMANLNYGVNMIFEDNFIQRCVDNAFEIENHGGNTIIRRNRIEDVYQAISWQPLGGLPWPERNYVYRNVFYRTKDNDIWGGGGAFLKIGIPEKQKTFPHLKEQLKDFDFKDATVPGGFWVFNNSIIDNNTRLVCELGGSAFRLRGIYIYNNSAVVANLRHPMARSGDGGVESYKYLNNRFSFSKSAAVGVAGLDDQKRDAAAIFPRWRQNSFQPAQFEAAVIVPGAPEQFKYIGALQRGIDDIGRNAGVGED